MILFLDTSSLVKLYVDEGGTDTVRWLATDADVVAVSRVAYPEAVAALGRRHREGDLSADALELMRERLTADWEGLLAVDLDEWAAADVALVHGLPGLDAVHLAAALELADVLGSVSRGAESVSAQPSATDTGDVPSDAVVFSTYDLRLGAAATAAGLWVAPGLSDPGTP